MSYTTIQFDKCSSTYMLGSNCSISEKNIKQALCEIRKVTLLIIDHNVFRQ